MIIGRLVVPTATPEKRSYTRKSAPVKMCAHCAISPRRKKGTLCEACIKYRQAHGELRPPALIQAALEHRHKQKWCKICQNIDVHADERCYACYLYLWRTGRERPCYRWDNDIRCVTCGYPKNAPGHFYRDRCGACSCYKRRTGIERPKALWGTGAYGFCDCGYPAEHQYDGFNLCNRCFSEATR